MYEVLLTHTAEKNLSHIPKKQQKQILAALDGLKENPFAGKRLQGPLEGIWSLRVWPYRILYSINKKIITITVLAIGHRQGVYKR